MAVGSALGLVKTAASDVPANAAARYRASETQRYSPWTGMQAEKVKPVDTFGNALAGAGTGLSMAGKIKALQAPVAGAGAATDVASDGWQNATLGVDTSMPGVGSPGTTYAGLGLGANTQMPSIGSWDAMMQQRKPAFGSF